MHARREKTNIITDNQELLKIEIYFFTKFLGKESCMQEEKRLTSLLIIKSSSRLTLIIELSSFIVSKKAILKYCYLYKDIICYA